jgi:hypothetical protein
MIQHPNFIFLHFPKMAGTKIEQIFKDYFLDIPGLIMDPVDDGPPTWHDSISDRQARDRLFGVRDRVIVTGFRRLPGWLASRAAFESQRSGIPWREDLIRGAQFLEADGDTVGHADLYARHWLPPGMVARERVQFIRLESFEPDFRQVLGQWLPVQRVPGAALRSRSNATEGDPALARAIYDGRQPIYNACPWWRVLESKAYPTGTDR